MITEQMRAIAMELENIPGQVPTVIEEEKVPQQSNHEVIE